MDIDVTIGREAFSLHVDNPYRLDAANTARRIRDFAQKQGIDINGLDLDGLIRSMVSGVFGCEEGCPADAKRLVSQGYETFQLQYTEGGILSATCTVGNSGQVTIRIFPNF
jgi:hypothetical protein